MQSASDVTNLIGFGSVFTLLFVTLGPLKILGPFMQLTRETDGATMKRIAVRAFVLAVIAVVVGGFAGSVLLASWNISATAMLVYAVFVSFGVYYIYKLLHEGPTTEATAIPGTTGSRPMAFADSAETATGSTATTGG